MTRQYEIVRTVYLEFISIAFGMMINWCKIN